MVEGLIIFLLFIFGKAFSLHIYRVCWDINAGKILSFGKLFLLCSPVIALSLSSLLLCWQDLSLTRVFASVGAIQLAVAAAGRFDPTFPCLIRRGITLLVSTFVILHPAWLLPSLFCTCLLQYRNAAWALNPGYSNLLGFEFSRSSLCSVITALCLTEVLSLWGFAYQNDPIILTVLLLHQASYYINNALAKNALGKNWCEWMMKNRIQYLVANAWLRGWTLGQNQSQHLQLYTLTANYRVAICWLAWGSEIAWLFTFLHPTSSFLLYSTMILFHLFVFCLTGLSCWHYIINHFCLLYLLSHSFMPDSNLAMVLFSLLGYGFIAVWVGLTRTRVLNEHQSENAASRWKNLTDPADHLMAWWDSPLMRMYTFTIETESGKHFFFPVTNLSPHDTAFTDIHTHLMILNLHQDFDAELTKDKQVGRTGVWGLLANRAEMENLYNMQKPEIKRDEDSSRFVPCVIDPESTHATTPLLKHFLSINQCIEKPLYRRILRWPHFPGEDHAPDRCPLVEDNLPCFPMDEAIQKVMLWRVKTWVSEGFSLLDHSLCIEMHLFKQNERRETPS
jgi:hypothetical protein